MGSNTSLDVEDVIFDDGEKIEIAGSYPDVETAIKALHESIDDDKA